MTATTPQSGKEQTRSSHRSSVPPSGKRSRSASAMSDAHQSLDAVLNPEADNTQPHIITQSGATRNQVRGRIAGPKVIPDASRTLSEPSQRRLPAGERPDSLLPTLLPGSQPLYEDEVDTAPGISRARSQVGIALASHVRTARDNAALLLNSIDSQYALDTDEQSLHTSRRAASKWLSRYATHAVILLVVASLVALGGLKTITRQGTLSNGLREVSIDTGTDYFADDEANGVTSVSSSEYGITLPRTELGGTDAEASSRIVQPDADQPGGDVGEGPATAPQTGQDARSIAIHKVSQGDTIQSVADKYAVMPETVMGSNGLYDSEEALTVGATLVVPAVDGMYYVPREGDTLDTISRRFQVDPAVIIEYSPNNLNGGQIKTGEPIVVPGGMIPQREVAITYTVKSGDMLKEIAARYGVDVPTMIRSNDIPDPDNLTIGAQLRVLPVSGMEYKVEQGDTLLSIASKLGVTPQMILDYVPNKLSADTVLQVEQVILVPGGSPQPVTTAAGGAAPNRNAEVPDASPKTDTNKAGNIKPAAPKPAPTKAAAKPATKPVASQPAAPKPNNSVKVGTGRMAWPIYGTITQYFSSSHNGLDIAIRAGTPIQAADAGKVIWSGWRTDGLGYAVFIDHGNGLTTVYGHQIRQPKVYVGQYVSKGQLIGWVGSTGRSTGPHVHFMVKAGTGRNYRNPLAYLGAR